MATKQQLIVKILQIEKRLDEFEKRVKPKNVRTYGDPVVQFLD